MSIKLGRNDPCCCGSTLKYKHCCLKNLNTKSIHEQISNIVASYDKNSELVGVLSELLYYMRENNWSGACHATAAVLFVALTEIGYSPKLFVGEVSNGSIFFDHSWIEIDDMVIDLAISLPLSNVYIFDPIVLDRNIVNMKKHDIKYGISNGVGLSSIAARIVRIPFCNYMDEYPNFKNGLWSVVEKILSRKVNFATIKEKYTNVQWNYVKV